MTIKFPEVSTYRWSCQDHSQRLPIVNPATGKTITVVQAGNASTAKAAIEAAQKAYDTDWRLRAPFERAMLLQRCADELEKNKLELAELLCMENGKPMKDALTMDVTFLIMVFRFFGSVADKLPTQFYDKGNTYSAVIYEPYGVCAGILPFNWPPIHTGGKVAPCLAAGNTIVLKPGDQAPLTVIRIVEIINTILPKDIVQVVPGLGPEVPNTLVTHPLVKKVSITGSTASGKAVGKAGADTLTHLTFELGGKNAFIVFEDADLQQAVRDAMDGAFFNKGEACTAASRMLVHENVYEAFVEKLASGVRRLRAGDGMDAGTHVGPCVSKEQQERVLRYIEVGKKEGARIVAQGELPTEEKCRDGFFVQPTLFTDVTREMTIAREEIFGPVATVTRFSTEDEAISITNESDYGLLAGVYTKDMSRAWRCARKIDVGMVFLNNFNRQILGTPFGGVKATGYGREHCIETLYDWSTAKNVRFPSGLGPMPVWRVVSDIFGNEGCEVKVE